MLAARDNLVQCFSRIARAQVRGLDHDDGGDDGRGPLITVMTTFVQVQNVIR